MIEKLIEDVKAILTEDFRLLLSVHGQEEFQSNYVNGVNPFEHLQAESIN